MPKRGCDAFRSSMVEPLESRLLFCTEPAHAGGVAAHQVASPASTTDPADLVARARVTAEPEAGTGIVQGHVFLDANANGIRAPRDFGLFNQTIYLDEDDDGVFDENEPSATTDDEGFYSMTVPQGNHVIRQVIWSKMRPSLPVSGGREITVTDGQILRNVDFGSYLAHPEIIDVMILYTPSARFSAGGQDEIRSLIKDSVADANAIFATSRVNVELRLVYRSEVSYDDSGTLDRDLTRLANTRDGYMDHIHELRDEHDADLVSLFVDFGEDADGIAYILDNHFPDPDELGFSVVRQEEAIGTEHVFAHEIGHNLGASHDRENADTDGAFDYSFAHRFTLDGKTYRTIMAYAPGTLLPVFSNSNLSYNGEPLGVAPGEPGEADNARTLRRNASEVAGFRVGDMAGNSRGNARVVGEILPKRKEVYRDGVGTGDRRDLYRIRVTQPVMVKARLTDLSANVNLRLLDRTGDTIAASKTPGQADEKIRTIVGAGTYYLRVPALDGNGGSKYRLIIQGADLTPEQIDPRKVTHPAVASTTSLFSKRSILPDDEDAVESLTWL